MWSKSTKNHKVTKYIKEKRYETRYEVNLKAVILRINNTKVKINIQIIDICIGGIGGIANKKFIIGDIVEMFIFIGDSISIPATVYISWVGVSDSGYNFISFLY